MVLSVLESGQHDEQAQAALQATMQDLKSVLQVRLNKAKKNGELSRDLDAGSIATTIATTMAGMMVLGKANFSKPVLKKTINQVLKLLD